MGWREVNNGINWLGAGREGMAAALFDGEAEKPLLCDGK